MHVRAHARIQTHGADVDGVAVVAPDYVYGPHLARHQLGQVEEPVLLVAEHADEVVARAAGEVRHGRVWRGAVYALVERAVAAAGVDAQVAVGLRVLPYLPAGVHGRAGDVYLKLVPLTHEGRQAVHRLVYKPQLILRLLLAGDRVDYEKVLHLF